MTIFQGRKRRAKRSYVFSKIKNIASVTLTFEILC